ncbi:peptide-aspartate beta-dioxygenase [Aureococcus anophagefferens]|nr:peptide-aspartate beta-dioxygenase [Aureococcus anophagefferens]
MVKPRILSAWTPSKRRVREDLEMHLEEAEQQLEQQRREGERLRRVKDAFDASLELRSRELELALEDVAALEQRLRARKGETEALDARMKRADVGAEKRAADALRGEIEARSGATRSRRGAVAVARARAGTRSPRGDGTGDNSQASRPKAPATLEVVPSGASVDLHGLARSILAESAARSAAVGKGEELLFRAVVWDDYRVVRDRLFLDLRCPADRHEVVADLVEIMFAADVASARDPPPPSRATVGPIAEIPPFRGGAPTSPRRRAPPTTKLAEIPPFRPRDEPPIHEEENVEEPGVDEDVDADRCTYHVKFRPGADPYEVAAKLFAVAAVADAGVVWDLGSVVANAGDNRFLVTCTLPEDVSRDFMYRELQRNLVPLSGRSMGLVTFVDLAYDWDEPDPAKEIVTLDAAKLAALVDREQREPSAQLGASRGSDASDDFGARLARGPRLRRGGLRAEGVDDLQTLAKMTEAEVDALARDLGLKVGFAVKLKGLRAEAVARKRLSQAPSRHSVMSQFDLEPLAPGARVLARHGDDAFFSEGAVEAVDGESYGVRFDFGAVQDAALPVGETVDALVDGEDDARVATATVVAVDGDAYHVVFEDPELGEASLTRDQVWGAFHDRPAVDPAALLLDDPPSPLKMSPRDDPAAEEPEEPEEEPEEPDAEEDPEPAEAPPRPGDLLQDRFAEFPDVLKSLALQPADQSPRDKSPRRGGAVSAPTRAVAARGQLAAPRRRRPDAAPAEPRAGEGERPEPDATPRRDAVVSAPTRALSPRADNSPRRDAVVPDAAPASARAAGEGERPSDAAPRRDAVVSAPTRALSPRADNSPRRDALVPGGEPPKAAPRATARRDAVLPSDAAVGAPPEQGTAPAVAAGPAPEPLPRTTSRRARVECRYMATSEFYGGVVASYVNGRYTVEYDDMGTEHGVDRLRLRLPGQAMAPPAVDAVVDAWHPGSNCVRRASVVGLGAERVTVKFDDDGVVHDVGRGSLFGAFLPRASSPSPRRRRRRARAAPTRSRRPRPTGPCRRRSRGRAARAHARRRRRRVPLPRHGRVLFRQIVADDGDGAFAVHYDDGDDEARVPRRKLRYAGQAMADGLALGETVDAACAARDGAVLPGMVVEVYKGGNYKVNFDDADLDEVVLPRDAIFSGFYGDAAEPAADAEPAAPAEPAEPEPAAPTPIAFSGSAADMLKSMGAAKLDADKVCTDEHCTEDHAHGHDHGDGEVCTEDHGHGGHDHGGDHASHDHASHDHASHDHDSHDHDHHEEEPAHAHDHHEDSGHKHDEPAHAHDHHKEEPAHAHDHHEEDEHEEEPAHAHDDDAVHAHDDDDEPEPTVVRPAQPALAPGTRVMCRTATTRSSTRASSTAAAAAPTVAYDDGDVETAVARRRLYVPGQVQAEALEVGETVDAVCDARDGDVLPATVASRFDDGTYEVAFDFGPGAVVPRSKIFGEFHDPERAASPRPKMATPVKALAARAPDVVEPVEGPDAPASPDVVEDVEKPGVDDALAVGRRNNYETPKGEALTFDNDDFSPKKAKKPVLHDHHAKQAAPPSPKVAEARGLAARGAEDAVREAAAGVLAASPSREALDDGAAPLAMGAKVLARYGEERTFYPAVVTGVHARSYAILFDDGDRDDDAPRRRLKLRASARPARRLLPVPAGRGVLPAVRDNGDGTYAVLFDDGDEDDAANRRAIYRPGQQQHQILVAGERVDAVCPGRDDLVLPGRVEADLGGDRYAVRFDAGSGSPGARGAAADADLLRLLRRAGAAAAHGAAAGHTDRRARRGAAVPREPRAPPHGERRGPPDEPARGAFDDVDKQSHISSAAFSEHMEAQFDDAFDAFNDQEGFPPDSASSGGFDRGEDHVSEPSRDDDDDGDEGDDDDGEF